MKETDKKGKEGLSTILRGGSMKWKNAESSGRTLRHGLYSQTHLLSGI